MKRFTPKSPTELRVGQHVLAIVDPDGKRLPHPFQTGIGTITAVHAFAAYVLWPGSSQERYWSWSLLDIVEESGLDLMLELL